MTADEPNRLDDSSRNQILFGGSPNRGKFGCCIPSPWQRELLLGFCLEDILITLEDHKAMGFEAMAEYILMILSAANLLSKVDTVVKARYTSLRHSSDVRH
jgi:hypothetical protein